MFKMIVFDMDWTLTLSRGDMQPTMISLFKELLTKYKVWVISWWDFCQFETQILKFIWNNEDLLKNLYICPTCSTKMYIFKDKSWQKLYWIDFTNDEKLHIISVLENAINKLWLKPEKTYWELIEDRWTQISYAAIWQQAPHEVKSIYDPDFKKRLKIRDYIKDDLKWFEVLVAWRSTIDITREWVDKAYWVQKLMDVTWINKNEIIFVWDAVFPWWNDYPPLDKLWITTKKVFELNDTEEFIRELIK